MIFPGTPGRFSDHDHAMRSNVGKGPKGDGIIADVVRDDPYGVYRVQFKNSRTGEVYLTTPNMDPGSRIYFCNLTLQYQSSEDVDVSYTVPLYSFSTQQVGTIRDARVGDMVFYKLRREGMLGANAIGIGIITNLSLDGDVTFMQHSVLDIENIDEIDAQVRRLQEDADNIETALDTVQSTLDDLPSYDEFLDLSENVRQNEADITTKIPWPIAPYSKYGTDGQVLRTNADGSTQWQNPVIPTDAQAETYINAWLNAHPEATTTVQDESVTLQKFSQNLRDTIFIDRYLYSGTDANDIIENGIYYCNATVANLPTNAAYTIFVTRPFVNNATVVCQISYAFRDGRMRYRKYQNGEWTSWTNYQDTIAETLRTNIQTQMKRKVLHQYGISEAVMTYPNKLMNSAGIFVDNTSYDSYVFPLFGVSGYVCITNAWSIQQLNSDYSFKMSSEQVDVAPLKFFAVQDDTPYFIVPISHNALENLESDSFCLRFSSFPNTSGYMPSFNLTDTYHYEFIGTNIITGTNYDFVMQSTGYPNIVTGKTEANSDDLFYSYPLVVEKGTKICSMYNTAAINVRCIDANGVYFKNATNTNRNIVFDKDTILILSVSKYAYVSNKLPTNISLEKFIDFVSIIPPNIQRENKWIGKHWYAYGTSITDIGTLTDYNNNSGSIGNGNNGNMGTYPLMVDALSGLVRHNGAIGSGGIVPSQPHGGNVKANILSCPSTADLVTLEIGPNDPWTTDAGIGELSDTGNDTIMGNLYQCLDYLTNNVNGVVIILLVQGSMYASNEKLSPNGSLKLQWLKFKNYAKEMAALFKVPVIDADSCVINHGKNTTGITLLDHIHPNYYGGAMLGRYIWSKIVKIHPYDFPITSQN